MPKLRITVDHETCIGDQLCCSEAPNTFEMNADDKAVVTNPEGDSEEHIMTAAKCCPVDCIHVYDEASGQKLYPE